jgi:hypothetical protein
MKLSSTMMTAAVLAAGVTPGHGTAALYVQSQARESHQHFQTPLSRGHARQSAMVALLNTYESSSLADWDGHGAAPVTHAVYLNAYRLLEVLPDGLPMPSPGAEPDGQLTLEWHKSAYQTLSVSVTADGDLHYAALLGASRTYGTEPFLGQLPQPLLDLIQRVTLG